MIILLTCVYVCGLLFWTARALYCAGKGAFVTSSAGWAVACIFIWPLTIALLGAREMWEEMD